MPDLKSKLRKVAEAAKKTIYPDKEELRRQWDRKQQQDKLNQTRKK